MGYLFTKLYSRCLDQYIEFKAKLKEIFFTTSKPREEAAMIRIIIMIKKIEN